MHRQGRPSARLWLLCRSQQPQGRRLRQPPAAGLGRQALAAQITALLGQAAQEQGVTVVILGDVHIHVVLGERPDTSAS